MDTEIVGATKDVLDRRTGSRRARAEFEALLEGIERLFAVGRVGYAAPRRITDADCSEILHYKSRVTLTLRGTSSLRGSNAAATDGQGDHCDATTPAPADSADAGPSTGPMRLGRAPHAGPTFGALIGLTDMHISAILMHMRTTMIIDDDLLVRAQELSGLREKTAVVHAGLRALIARESGRRLAALGGTERGLKPIPRRRTRPAR